MEVKILTLILSFVLYQSVVLQVIESPININNQLNTPFNNVNAHPKHRPHDRPSSVINPDQNINWQNWITSFPDRFPFNNHRLNNRLIPFHLAMRRPMHNHMINTPSQSHLGTNIFEEYLNRHNTPNHSMTMTKPNINGNNMNKPTNLWYRPHGTESSMGLLNRPSNKPCQSHVTEISLLNLNPPGPTTDNQAVDTLNHEHVNPNILNSKPPKDIQEDPISDDSSPDIDIRGGFDG